MPRNRAISRVGRGLMLLLILSSGRGSYAQPAAATAQPPAITPAPTPVPAAPVARPPASNWPWALGVLGGIALGVLGARLWARSSGAVRRGSDAPESALSPVPTVKMKPAENVVKMPIVQLPSQMQSSQIPPALPARDSPRPAGGSGKSKPNQKKNPSSRQVPPWPATVPHRPAAMNLTPPPVPPAPASEPLETGQTIEWVAPTAIPLPIQELIDATADEVPAVGAALGAVTVPIGNGPLHYYAPAPDVPSIEHRKLSPNPLPQMPLLVTLPHAEATTAQFSFSPQADQSRIIGNGVRELKEFFAFELPPTEQFTTIKNLSPGKLEKRDDVWHVVQKADIALS